ncbi:MAG: PAS domain S-box protein, partial [bacterium]
MGKVRDKNTSNKLKVSPDLFQRAVDNAFDHMIITDVDGTIIYANKAVEKITGYSLKEIIGAKPSLWGREMSVEFYQDLWRIIKVQKKSFVGEITNCRKSGERYIAELHIAPVLDDEGKVIMFIGIERDITKQKRIDQMKTDFVSFVSHELRTPLTVISFSTEMLLSDNVNSFDHKQAQLLQEIYRR